MNRNVKELELFEVVFILGYDLLHDSLVNSGREETDIAYSRCLEIAEDFLNSEYNREDKALYTCVVEYLMYSENFEKFSEKFNISY
jgi:hypothetical protein